MRVSDIIRLAQDYMGLAIVLVGILGVCFILGYFVIYKKVFKGEKQLSKGRVALMAIFLCYSIQLISYGFDDLILVQTVNTGLLMYLYLDKILKVFYYRIHDRAYFKGTFTNLFFLYLFFFLLSIDLLINKSIWAALLTSIVIVLLILFRIEKIFYKNIFDKRSRKCRLLI